MTENTIYAKIEETTEKIKNKEDMEDVTEDISEICKSLYKLPLYQECVAMMKLFNDTYDTCLIANTKKGE